MPRNAPVNATFDALLDTSVELLDDILSELDDNLSNMKEKFSGTERYSIFEAARDATQEQRDALDDLDRPENVSGDYAVIELRVKWPSKQDRLDNVIARLNAARELLGDTEQAEAEHNENLDQPSDRTERSEALEEFSNQLDEIVFGLNYVEFS